MSSKKNVKPKKIVKNNKEDKKISSIIEVKEKDNKIVYILILIIAILLSLVIFFAFFNKKEKEIENDCSKCESSTIKIEVEPDYQLVNYAGFRFKMPLDWDFVSDDDLYKISNTNENIFINFEKLDYDFETFVTDEIQRKFLESIQTSDNIKIDKSEKIYNYYSYEGKYNDYNYLIIAIGNNKKTVLVKTQFIDKISYDNEKNNIIEFALSSIKESEK